MAPSEAGLSRSKAKRFHPDNGLDRQVIIRQGRGTQLVI
jgi:hypothetical protein